MKTKNLFYALSITVAAIAMTACSSENDATTDKNFDNTSAEPRTWQVSINAGPAELTRAISVGGNSGKVLYTNWDTGDKVEVLKKNNSDGTFSKVGSLTATASTGNSAYAVLEGELTGTFAVDDELKLYYHSVVFDYTGQKGTLADVSTNKSYLTAECKVEEIIFNDPRSNIISQSGKLVISDAAFTAEQAYVDITFTDDGGNPYNITKLEIYTDGGKLVKQMNGFNSDNTLNNSIDYANLNYPLVITPESATNHFFLALRDEYGSTNTYVFKATTDDNRVLTHSENLTFEKGHYYISSSPRILYAAPTINVQTQDITIFAQPTHTGYCYIGSVDEEAGTKQMEVTISGKSRAYYIDLGNPATVTLNGVNASIYGNSFINGKQINCEYVYDIQGDNTIFNGEYYYAIYANQNESSVIKLKGNGTLTVTCGNHDYCGILASNYRESNNQWNTTTELDVSEQLAAEGYTVKRSTRINNADGTYTWKYTVSPSNNSN